MTSSFTFKI